MMKKILLSAVLSMFVSSYVSAQSLVIDRIVTKGIRYKKYTMTGPNQEIHVLAVDLNDPTVKLEVVKAGNLVTGGTQTVKAMAAGKDKNSEYHNVVGAVNGDFFDANNAPYLATNVNVLNGEVLVSKFPPTFPRSVFAISQSNDPFIGRPAEVYRVTRPGGSPKKIDKVNGARGTNELVLYNQYHGATTGTNVHGTELRLQLVPGQKWRVNGSVQCKVVEKRQLMTGMAIPDGEAILSGNGLGRVYLDSIAVNTILTLNMNVLDVGTNLDQISGGYPRIVTNGQVDVFDSINEEGGSQSHDTTPDNPHTGAGISQDGNTLYLMVVDGRNPANRHGMTLTQFAQAFITIGAYNAVNFDGGWSSTLVSNNVVMNVPAHNTSPGIERSVSAALLVWSTQLLMDDFEAGEGRYYEGPNYDGVYTVGIGTSTLDRVTTTAYSGVGSERAVLNDNTGSPSAWTVRLLSGRGLPAENYSIESTGTVGVWLKTNTAQPGAKIHLWFDDTDGAEQTPGITIINDGQWHQYNFDLNYSSGGTAITGNGLLTGANVSLDAIVLKQPNPPAGAPAWTLYFDEVTHNKAGSGTGAMLMAQPPQEQSVVLKSPEPDLEPVLYSNPNNGTFAIDFKQQEVIGFDLEVVSFEQGKTVYRTKLNGNNQQINAGKLPEGLYSVNITGLGCSKRIRMIVQ